MSQGSRKELEILGQVFQRIHRFQEKYWRDGLDLSGSSVSQATMENYQSISAVVCYPIKTKELDEIIKAAREDGNLQLEVGNLFLPPLDLNKEFIPILSVNCDYRTTPPSMRLCVGMFSLDKKRELEVFSFRFETGNSPSNHDYCHAQFVRRFRREGDGVSFSSLPDWVPETYPCILVPANNPISLIFCMLLSFYGKNAWQRMLSDLNIDGKYFATFRLLNVMNN